ncbi:MAG TPA: hypothetical protein VMH05_06035 [Bryobacteraceae bacterium]|nr:hypothetical protein [Bryobacteraceae bacterium]
MVKPETHKQWIEEELERSLRRVSAPEELWDRVQSPQQARARLRTRFMAWAAVPMLMFVAVWGTHSRNNPAIQLHSSDPAEIRSWVKANTGLDVPLHAGNLAGAKVVSSHTAEIAYRVAGRDVSLVVSDARPSARRNGRSVSWMSGGQTYLLACAEPQDFKACVMCHVGG